MTKKIIIFLLLLIPLLEMEAKAHPGNTDSSGGHTCQTNCGDWGLEYGEYHYHDESPPQNYQGIDYYNKGYDQGYDLAYSYTSQCEEEYEWWWEGPNSFGEGYEAGINDGHYEGLEVCFEESYQTGYVTGDYDYIQGNEYDETPYQFDVVDESSYGKGYAEGWEEAKALVPPANDEIETVTEEEVEKEINEEDIEESVSGESYYSSMIIGVIAFTFIGGLLFLISLINKRKARYGYVFTERQRYFFPLIGASCIIGFIYWLNSDSSVETNNIVEADNPYSETSLDHDCSDFDTQEDAQLFFEANGGPDYDEHDLDRDGDGIACDWNP
jgi:Excalibur calcium-binding domain